MNNAQLQEAIDKTQQFVANKDVWSTTREMAVEHLKKLYAIQYARAGMMNAPKLTKVN